MGIENDFLDIVRKCYEENIDIKHEKFKDLQIERQSFEIVEFQNCEFQNCKILSSELKKVTFADLKFTNCDFSNTSFEGASFIRCTFDNCKCTGGNFIESRLYSNLIQNYCLKSLFNKLNQLLE